METCDVLVIGGGPAGSASAHLLAKAGFSVALMEQAAFPRRKVCGEFVSAGSLPVLARLGILDAFLAEAGSPVRQVGLFAGEDRLQAPMPAATGEHPWGRALGRERLDALLLEQAGRAGARIWQPWKAIRLDRAGKGWICEARDPNHMETCLRASVVVAAHGAWETGQLPTQARHAAANGRKDGKALLGFKAHFRDAGLTPGLMPLLAFDGGYGGMVHTDRGRVSLSCCLRRDLLARLRRPGEAAGAAVQRYILGQCRGAALALDGAGIEGGWLAAGPLSTGWHRAAPMGVFAVGNAAAEAHPVIAEGLSIALQSAALLADILAANFSLALEGDPGGQLQARYRLAWRSRFGQRLRMSALVAALAMRPSAVALLLPLLRRRPQLLSVGARLVQKHAISG